MPGNQWGTAAPGFLASLQSASGDVVCGAGAETTVITSTTAIVAPGQGNWFFEATGFISVLFGATPPTAMSIVYRIHGGAIIFQHATTPGAFVANGTLVLPTIAVGNQSGTAWYPAGSIVDVNLNPAAQPVTFKFVTSGVLFKLFRGPDN